MSKTLRCSLLLIWALACVSAPLLVPSLLQERQATTRELLPQPLIRHSHVVFENKVWQTAGQGWFCF